MAEVWCSQSPELECIMAGKWMNVAQPHKTRDTKQPGEHKPRPPPAAGRVA